MKSSRSLRLKKAEKEIRALGETRGVLTSCLISRGSALKRIAAACKGEHALAGVCSGLRDKILPKYTIFSTVLSKIVSP